MVVVGVILLVALVGYGLIRNLGKARVYPRRTASETYLRAIAQGMHTYASEPDGMYPSGFGVLIWEGLISPDVLLSPSDARESNIENELLDFDWRYDDDALPFNEMNRFAAERSSYIVLAWGEQRVFNADRVLAYERLDHRASDGPLVVFHSLEVVRLPPSEAAAEILEAGFEPVWADGSIKHQAP